MLRGGARPGDRQPRPAAFRLRTTRDEQSLSFYALSVTTAEAIRDAGPSGCGVLRVSASVLRDLGFVITPDPVEGQGEIGEAHVAAMLPALIDGQIPISTQFALVAAAEWLLEPN